MMKQKGIAVRPEDEHIWLEAQRIAKLQDISLAALVARALDDYITLHQPVGRRVRSQMTRAW